MAAAVAGGEVDVEPKHLDYELLKALQSGDRITVEKFFSQEVSMAIDRSDADNIADQAGRWRGVTVGGNSALHIAADFGHLELAELICTRNSSLLTVRNVAGETPLHCAARAGADRIVSLFLSEARRLEVLRAKDREGKTALHAAAQEGRAAVVRVLMSADSGLAAIDDDNGVSPLYAAVLSGSLEVVQILIGSHAGEGDKPVAAANNGVSTLCTNVLLRSLGVVQNLIGSRAGGGDKLNAAAGIDESSLHRRSVSMSAKPPKYDKYISELSRVSRMRGVVQNPIGSRADEGDTPDASFAGPNGQTALHAAAIIRNPNSQGLYPIHVAAMNGRSTIISELTNSCPGMSELVDGRGRNFLHIAIQHEEEEIVGFVCRRLLLSKMMNARDCEGNTPLHLAVKSKNQTIVSLLLENISVHLSIVNKDGESPLDFAIADFDIHFTQLNTQNWIYECLKRVGAINGPRGLGHLFDENLTQPDLEKESEKYKNALQNLLVASVLIATVTFAAVFTMPGGYIADDQQNGGSPTLGGKYAFKVFIMADNVAFSFSVVATLVVMYAGSQAADPSRWVEFIVTTQDFIRRAALFMVTAFAMSLYVQLAPLSKELAILGCTGSFSATLTLGHYLVLEKFLLAKVLRRRMGWSGMFKNWFFIFSPLSLPTQLVFILIFLLPLWPTNCNLHNCNLHKHSS